MMEEPKYEEYALFLKMEIMKMLLVAMNQNTQKIQWEQKVMSNSKTKHPRTLQIMMISSLRDRIINLG